MPTVYPIKWEPLVRGAYYRNLQRRDLAVWERFIERHGTRYDAVAYDVAVGGLEPAAEDTTDAERAGWKYTTALKIDALLRDAQGVTLAEIKPACTVSAFGAVLCYRLLLERDEPQIRPVGVGVVCEVATPDQEWLAAELDVQLFVV